MGGLFREGRETWGKDPPSVDSIGCVPGMVTGLPPNQSGEGDILLHSQEFIHFNAEGWWNKELCMLYVQWLRRQFHPKQNIVLVWDSGPGQTDREVLDWCWAHNIRVMVVPGGCTGLCQPLDLLVMKPFKVLYGKQYQVHSILLCNFFALCVWPGVAEECGVC
jgi:hypothetical protein